MLQKVAKLWAYEVTMTPELQKEYSPHTETSDDCLSTKNPRSWIVLILSLAYVLCLRSTLQ